MGQPSLGVAPQDDDSVFASSGALEESMNTHAPQYPGDTCKEVREYWYSHLLLVMSQIKPCVWLKPDQHHW